MTVTATKPRSVTYMGVPARVHEIRKAGAHGERVVITRWEGKAIGQPTEWESGTVVARHCKGDGRKASFQVFDLQIFDHNAGAERWAEERLA